MNEKRYEYLSGNLVYMDSPDEPHNDVNARLVTIFNLYLGNTPYKMFGTAHDVVFDNNSMCVPDFFIVCDRSKLSGKKCYGSPDFIIEILSPFNQENDLVIKKEIYQQHGVQEYWIIDPRKKNLRIYLLHEDYIEHFYEYPDMQISNTILLPQLPIRWKYVFGDCTHLEGSLYVHEVLLLSFQFRKD